jgi:hypothetical protein
LAEKNESVRLVVSKVPMTSRVSLYSKVYLEQEDESWSARPSRRLLEDIHRDDEDSARWIAVIGGVRIALGDPIVSATGRSLYIPRWILDTAGMDGNGEDVDIRFERSETLEKATRLVFEVIGEIPDEIQLRDLLEEPLSQLGVLEEGQIIPAPIMDGVYLLVKACEPSGQPVFLDGAEVALEIENDSTVPLAPLGPVGAQGLEEQEGQEGQREQEEEIQSMVPISTPVLQSYGGKLPFVPFQGLGRRLCD